MTQIMNPSLEEFIKSRTPKGRAGAPEEVADVIVYLASPGQLGNRCRRAYRRGLGSQLKYLPPRCAIMIDK